VLCQQFCLFPIRVQPELVCSVNLSHIAYKDSNYFVNNKTFLYIYGMKEDYKLKEDKWIEHVVIKLRSEGLNRLSYTTEKAISFLQDCVAGQRLIGTLIRNESKVISMLPGEVMQQKLF